MHYHFRHQHWQTYVLNLSDKHTSWIFNPATFIFSKLSFKLLSKLFRKFLLVLVFLLLSSLWSLQALPAKNDPRQKSGQKLPLWYKQKS
jgi:uncharacterized membrane protein YcfT